MPANTNDPTGPHPKQQPPVDPQLQAQIDQIIDPKEADDTLASPDTPQTNPNQQSEQYIPKSGIRVPPKANQPTQPQIIEFTGSRHQATAGNMSSIQLAKRRRNLIIIIITLIVFVIITIIYLLFQMNFITFPNINIPEKQPHALEQPTPTATTQPPTPTIFTPQLSPIASPTEQSEQLTPEPSPLSKVTNTPAPILAIAPQTGLRQPITPQYISATLLDTSQDQQISINIYRTARITSPNLPITGDYLLQIQITINNSESPVIARAIESSSGYQILNRISHPQALEQLGNLTNIDQTTLSYNDDYTIEALEYPDKIDSSNGLASYKLIAEKRGRYDANTVQALFTNSFGQVFTTQPAVLNQNSEQIYDVFNCPESQCLNLGYYYVFRPDNTYLIYQ